MQVAELSRPTGLRWAVLVTAVLAFASLQVAQLAIAPILPQIAGDLGVDAGAATALMGVFLLTACLTLLFFGGPVCDRFGVMAALLTGLLLAALPAALMPWVGATYAGAVSARAVTGCSAGFLFPAMGAIVARWFPPTEKGLASGLMGTSISVGSAVGVVAGPSLYVATGSWQQTCAWGSLPAWGGLVFGLLLLAARRRGLALPASTRAGPDGSDFRAALRAGRTWNGVLVIFMAAWVLQCLYGLVPGFLSAAAPLGAGYGPVLSGRFMLGVMVAGAVGPIIGGLLMDKVFRGRTKPLLLIGFLLTAIFIYLVRVPAVYGTGPLLLTSLVLAGLGIQFVYPAIFVLIGQSYPPHIVGKMSGIWSGLGTLGGVLGMALGGITVKAFGSYGLAIALIAAAGACGLLATSAMGSPPGRPES